MQQAILILENNEIFYGKSVGYKADSYGEIVFNTAMTGYQEVVTDPSYKNQIITFTYPHIGNVGVNEADKASASSYVSGLVIRETPLEASNWRSIQNFSDYLKKMKIVCIAEIDTRHITTQIRNNGAMKACIIHNKKDINKAKKKLNGGASMVGSELASKVSSSKRYAFKENIFQLPKKAQNTDKKFIYGDFSRRK